jgi:hypothetical protein
MFLLTEASYLSELWERLMRWNWSEGHRKKKDL